ncbi:MAG: SUMF1/EgtB/PvdO family nonheme iron enzyme [Anaerolinea sp.]|nr:SUMF1/EgtB/PvdO family nonheme iron enzyme [Anaerolinea sp.]
MNKAAWALCTPSVGTARQVRGGSWQNNRNNLRCANRNRNTPNNRNNNVGFRCANTHRRPAKMPQWSATATAAGAGALPNVRRCRLETDALCQKGVHALFRVTRRR